MSAKIFRPDKLPETCIDSRDSLMTTLYLAMAAGGEKLYANIDRLQPGAKSCKFHSHSKQEEFFMILKGEGTVRLGNETLAVRAGDYFCKPAGKAIAHQFVNTSAEVMEILDVGLVIKADEVFYPDENVTYIKAEKKFYKDGQIMKDWSTDANN